MKNFDACLKPLLEHEGGNDDDPQDPGGRTSRGIIQSEYNAYRTRKGLAKRDVWTASDVEVRDIYKTEYWDAMRCDDLPNGVDYAVFDYGVNSGIGRSAKELQQVVGTAIDGEIGPDTIKHSFMQAPSRIVDSICDERIAFLRGLSTWPRFGRGWATRVKDVRTLALKMTAEAPIATTSPSRGWLSAIVDAVLSMFRKTPTKPAPTSTTPLWVTWALKEVGFHEQGQNQGLEKYITLAKTGEEGDPWCALFVNAALEATGIRGSRSAMARSFETSSDFVKLAGPAYGAIATMWRGSPSSGTGHCFFYLGENDKGILALGGNQSDQVCKQYEPRERVVGYFWPKFYALPKIGKLAVEDDTTSGGSES